MLFAFEEAIGFMMGQLEHDKDGISAAVRPPLCAACEMASWLRPCLVECRALPFLPQIPARLLPIRPSPAAHYSGCVC